MKKLFLCLIVSCVLMSMVFAAGEQEASSDSEGIIIAYVTPALHVPFWKNVSDGIKQEAEKVGQKVIIIDSDSELNAATQLQNVQDLIQRGVDGIIISPTDSASCPPVLELAKADGIPVVISDIGTDSGEFVSFIISDNFEGAYQAGAYLADIMKKKGWDGGDVAQIAISQARQNGRDRTAGFAKAMDEAGINIVNLLQCNQYTRGESFNFTQDLLAAHENLHGLFTQHDEANLGALSALENTGDYKIIAHVGFDGSPETVEAIKSGDQIAAASMQQPVLMGRESFKAMWEYLNGGTPEEKVLVPTILVTRENVLDVEDQLADNVFPAELEARK
ncbi:substrate-binding domain-containing protein [Marispirochaeta sp.]|uniref:substrate-binding domain-containing protein n=1 Tax=Marispirochaeta sp. TaxID=2038653 RepID=UPI0029C658F6|nr:substrate-binding domain-containing protein [Marispirochaeta sp.]